jgi:stress response protein YsnF
MNHRPAAATVTVVEEELEVDRRKVDTGHTLRLRKSVEELPVVEHAAKVHESVEFRRVPIGRVVSEPVAIRHEGDVTIVPVMEERVVTRKELVLVEEIHVIRRREVSDAKAELTLRRERVVIERFDPEKQQWLSEDEGSLSVPTSKE